jgi:hypothetical protein
MKKILLILVSLFLITACAHIPPPGKITYKASLYEYFIVAEGGSQGSINNLGEIVYITRAGMISTTRGRLKDTSYDKRFPRINDSGEVVYCGPAKPTGEGPWTVYSTARGRIAYGFTPSINNSGEIVYMVEQAYRPTINSINRGTLVTIKNGPAGYHLDINNSGEVIYKVNNQIFSTTRGLITTVAGSAPSGITINNLGDILYSSIKGVFYMDGANLTAKLSKISTLSRFGGPVDVNDYGDFVFSLWFSGSDKSYLLLATQRPEYYENKYNSWKKFPDNKIPSAP